MSSKVFLKDVCTRICSGGTPKRSVEEYYKNGRIPWLNTSEIKFNRIRKTTNFITDAGLENSSAKWIESNSVVVAMYGATAGKVAISKIPLTTNQACCNLEIDPSIADYRYIYYWLKSRNDLLTNLTNGGAQQNLNAQIIKNLEINLPSIGIQARIANHLSLLDDKIELNNQLNDYLAKLVSLEFEKQFGANTPAVDLSNVLDISTKTVKPQDYMEEIWEHYSIPAFDEARWPTFEPANKIKSNKYVIDGNCILISKLNPSIKRLWIPPCITSRSVCSTEFIVYKPKKPEYKSFYNAAIDSDSFSNYLLQHVTGSTGSRQRSQPKATLTYPIPNPDEKQIAFFCAFADPIYNQIRNNEIECQKLKTLRDLLLPKLVTGEINSSVIDIM